MRAFLLALTALFALTGCQNTYLAAMEQAGIPKRQILQNRVEDARQAQIKARFQFSRSLDNYRHALQAKDSSTAEQYTALEQDYRDTEKAARAVGPRIDTVEQVADALFDEWRDELDRYSDPGLKQASRDEMQATLAQYNDLLGKMRTAQSHIDPALAALRDQLLFFKHHLNAQAINSMDNGYSSLQGNIEPLLTTMQRSINDTDSFVRQLQRSAKP
jgi:hypothetical protein